MTGFKKVPWLSLSLLVVAYGVFGRNISNVFPVLDRWLIEQSRHWGWTVPDEDVFLLWLFGIRTFLLACLVLLTATPLALSKLVVGDSFKSEGKAVYYFLAWSLAAVFFFRWIHYSLQLLLLVSATILGRLELQYVCKQEWLVVLILLTLSLLGFGLGVLSSHAPHPFGTGHV